MAIAETITSHNKVSKTEDDLKYLTCVENMQKAIPDPNDTDGRSKFLQDCYK